MEKHEIRDPAVVVSEVSKTYVIRGAGSSDLSLSRFSTKRKTVHALSGVSFATHAGESVGLIGLNGSGKSTLLRIIAGTEAPTKGVVEVESHPVLLGVQSALQSDLSGADNIFLGCLALGMHPGEARERIGEIVEWTELGAAVERPISTYSSGMSARLNFAISTSIRPKILLVDEALSTGDAAFVSKAESRMQELVDEAGNLFVVSHSAATISRMCKRAIWLSDGVIVADGNSEEVVPKYREWTLMRSEDPEAAVKFIRDARDLYSSPTIEIHR